MLEPGLLILVGGGGHAKVVYESAESTGFAGTIAYLDDAGEDAALAKLGVRCLGTINNWENLETLRTEIRTVPGRVFFIGGLGDNAQRKRIMESLPLQALQQSGTAADQPLPGALITHASAQVSPYAVLGPGTFIGPGAVVNADARIGNGVIINSGAIVEHDCTLGAYAHLAPGAILGGAVQIGAETLVGLGARVLPGISIGTRAVIAAGAVVCANVADDTVVRGVPAR